MSGRASSGVVARVSTQRPRCHPRARRKGQGGRALFAEPSLGIQVRNKDGAGSVQARSPGTPASTRKRDGHLQRARCVVAAVNHPPTHTVEQAKMLIHAPTHAHAPTSTARGWHQLPSPLQGEAVPTNAPTFRPLVSGHTEHQTTHGAPCPLSRATHHMCQASTKSTLGLLKLGKGAAPHHQHVAAATKGDQP